MVYFLFSFHSTSRSQCIINIRGVADKFDGEDNNKANEVVLSIVDLAGAEREKRTGNQVWLCFFFLLIFVSTKDVVECFSITFFYFLSFSYYY